MATQSDVYALRSQVSALQSENSELRREIDAMISSLRNVTSTVSSLKETAVGTLSNGERTINTDDGILHGVDKKEVEIRHMMELYKNMENAYKTIRGLNNDLRYHQSGEKNVRKMLVAMLDNETKNLASAETIAVQAEKQYLNTQYFFLSHILMDLQLRKRGETEAADRARKEALKMDGRRTTWVYFLIALRRGDNKERDYWIDKLVKTPLLGSEENFLKVLAVIALCDKGKGPEKLRTYIGFDSISEGDKTKFVNKIIVNYKEVMSVRPPEFKFINKHISESADLREALYGALNNESVEAYIEKLAGGSGSEARAQFYSDMLDEMVEYCRSPKSDEIKAKIAYQEKIIEAKGVIADAEILQAEENIMLASDLDVEGTLFKWLTGSENFVGKKEITEFSYKKFRASYKRAYHDYVKSYRSKYKETLTLNIGEYSAKTTLTNADADESNIDRFLVERNARTKAAIKDTKFYLCVIFGAILLVAGVVVNFLGAYVPSPWNTVALVVGVVAGLVLAVLGVKIKYSNYRARIRADELLAEDRIKYIEVLRCVYTDIAAYRTMYKENDKKAIDDKKF